MTDLGDTAFRCGAGMGFSRTMEFFTLHRSPGVTHARWFSIARRLDHAGVGPLARRGRRRGSALGVPGCTGVGAGPTGSARVALSACRVAGDLDPGDRGRYARVCRVRHVGGHRSGGSAFSTGYSFPTAEREDVPVRAVAAGPGRP